MKTPFWLDSLPFVLIGLIMTVLGLAVIFGDGKGSSGRKGSHPNTATIPAIRILTGGS